MASILVVLNKTLNLNMITKSHTYTKMQYNTIMITIADTDNDTHWLS